MQPKVEVSSTKPIAYESRTYLSSQSPQIVVNKPESSPKVHVINFLFLKKNQTKH